MYIFSFVRSESSLSATRPYFTRNNIEPRIREWCVLVSAELALDGSQPLLTLPQLSLGQAVSILGAQGVTQLFQSLEVLSCLGEAAIRRDTSLVNVDRVKTVSKQTC